MSAFQVITIDLDDTLWEIHPVIHRAERRLYEWIQSDHPRVAERYDHEALTQLRADVVDQYPHMGHDYTFLRRTVLRRVGREVGGPDDFVDQAMEVFDRERNSVDIFPEVLPTLEALREHYRLVAVTNGNARLDMIGIDHLFDAMISAREAGAAKPAPQIFERAVAAGGATAAQTLHVGDHPEMDVVGAQQAGLSTVWVNRNEHPWPDHLAPADLEVQHIGEIPAWLERRRGA
ncbi:MAG: HAD family hydrolase [Pseudomonadota bacterium]